MSARTQRVILYSAAAAVVGWILWQMFYPDYARERCARLGYQAVLAEASSNRAPLSPTEARWYAEHCWQGAPRQ